MSRTGTTPIGLAWRLFAKNNGGAEGNRTPDLVIANDALSQLSYGPDTRRGMIGRWACQAKAELRARPNLAHKKAKVGGEDRAECATFAKSL
jgi:hypothetical protein